MPKVMFFAHDAGGANAIAPLISEFPDALIFAKGPAIDILPKCEQIPENALYIHMPDFLITGTSYPDLSENELWSEAAKLKIKSMAILDYWVNYKIRFSKCYPQYFVVMDELAKKEAIAEGIPENIIFPFGNPHFENIASKKQITILFAPQNSDDDILVLRDLLKISNVKICIRQHPRDTSARFNEFKSLIDFDASSNSIEAILKSDIVVSISSMLLLEALIVGKRAVSYQPNAKSKNEFILTKNGILPFINSFADFERAIMPVNCNGIIKKIVDFVMEKSLCQS